jgi:hypothetical protein
VLRQGDDRGDGELADVDVRVDPQLVEWHPECDEHLLGVLVGLLVQPGGDDLGGGVGPTLLE